MIGAVLLVLLGAFLTVMAFVVWALCSDASETPTAPSRIEQEQRRAEQRVHQITQQALQQMFDLIKEGL